MGRHTKIAAAAACAPLIVLILVIVLLFGGGGAHETIDSAEKGGRVALDFNGDSVPSWATGPLREAATTCPEITAPILAAQIETESNWNPNAHNASGADGLTQFMPSTWATWGLDGDGDGRADPRNPADAIKSQAAYMCHLVDYVKGQQGLSGSVVDLALASYNAGPGNVTKYRGIPPFTETTNYVAKINRLAASKYGKPRPGGGDSSGGTGGVSGAAGPVIEAARKQIGLPYAWGGGGLNGPSGGSAPDVGVVGFDCSSLVRFAYYQGTNGKITLPRTSREQYAATQSRRIPAEQLQPGDLLFWGKSPGSIHHVALYIGNGKMIEAPESGKKLRETQARTSGGDFFAATRVQDPAASAA
ncbi:NlpC/P60 family protein [Amycolatopsis anabasis]|uniref:C40 family peptidase n=1 Tax=Amycolatopsis anabasis TaxID=1840409 RepID=UPI00131DA32E|nr:NlpC/P60 family protein [Amycolatopsis anabasis]